MDKQVLIEWQADNGKLKNVMAENIELNSKMQSSVKETSREINKSMDKAAKSFDGVNKELSEGVKKQRDYGQEQEKLGKSTDSLFGGIGKLKGVFVGLFAAIGAAGGLKVLIQTRLEIDKQTRAVRNLTGETKVASREIVKEIRAIGKAYEKDFQEVLIASNAISKEFGINQKEVLKQIQIGFKAGSDANGGFLDTLREYPAQFRAAGLSADQMFKLINRSVKEGIFSDKGPDVIKEGTLRLREMTSATRDALKGIGLNSTEIQKALEDGTKTIFEVIQEVSAQLDKLPPQSAKVGTAIADIFGGPGEDAGLRFITLLKDIDNELVIFEDDADVVVMATQRWSKAVDSLALSFTGNGGLSKAISQIVNLGADFVEFISSINEVKASDELRSQQQEMNILVGAIQKTNVGEGVRLRLINELQQKYPDFLGNLQAETATNEQLAGRLEDVNKQLEQKVLNILKEEELTDLLREQVELRTREGEILKDIVKEQENPRPTINSFGDPLAPGASGLNNQIDEVDRLNIVLKSNREEQENVEKSILALDEKYKGFGLTLENTSEKIKKVSTTTAETVGGEGSKNDPFGYVTFLQNAIATIDKSIRDAPNDPRLIQALLGARERLQDRLTETLTLQDSEPSKKELSKLSQKISKFITSAAREAGEEASSATESESSGTSASKKNSFLSRLLGIDDGQEKFILDTLQTTLINVRNILTTDAQLRERIADQNIDNLDRQINNQQANLEAQIELSKAGLANNVDAAQEEIDRLNEIRKQENANRREALREQQRLATIEQGISLVTAVANIFKEESKLGVIGTILAIASIGTMFAAFASSKAKTAELTQPEGFFDGGFSDESGFTGNGNIFGESKKVGNKPYTYHKGEYIANHEKTSAFKPLFEAMESGSIKSMEDLSLGNMDKYGSLKSPHVTGVNLKALEAAKSNERSQYANKILSANNQAMINEVSQLRKTNERHFKWLEEVGIAIPMPNGDVEINSRNKKRLIKKV